MAAITPFLQIAGTAFSVAGAISGASSQANAAKYNAQVAERNAQVSRAGAAADAQTLDRRARQRIGAARAAYGAAGVDLEGSPLDVLEQSAAEAEMDKMNILYKGELQAMGMQDTAALNRSRADAAIGEGVYGAGRALLIGSVPGATRGEYLYDDEGRIVTRRGDLKRR
ncbi:MAG: hypothetical protein GEV05_11180 [Betaproteobacteria bacterium]|nr:hypothetical protein [Betaproteobacteria bacterium]